MEAIDTFLFYLINRLAGSNTLIDTIFIAISQYSLPILVISLFFTFIVFFKKREIKMVVIFSIISALLSGMIAKGVSLFYYHTQPFARLSHVNQLISKTVDNAFPSDHATVFFGVLMMFFFSTKGPKRWFFPILAFLVGLSRIWVGVHSPVDIVVGALLGSLTAWCVYHFLPIFSNVPVRKHQLK